MSFSTHQQSQQLCKLRLHYDIAACGALRQDAVAQRGERCAPPLEGISAARGAEKQHDREANGKGKLPFCPFHRKTAHLKEFASSMDGFLSFQTNSAQKVLTHSPCSASHALRQAALSEKRPNTTLPEPVIADVFAP